MDKITTDLNPMTPPNSDVQFLYIQISILSGYMKSPFTLADDYLGTHGDYTNQYLYQDLKKKDPVIARAIFEKHKNFYHPYI